MLALVGSAGVAKATLLDQSGFGRNRNVRHDYDAALLAAGGGTGPDHAAGNLGPSSDPTATANDSIRADHRVWLDDRAGGDTRRKANVRVRIHLRVLVHTDERPGCVR